MDFKKFLVIVAKDVRLLFTDRAALMINILTPLVMTFVIGAAFSGIGGGGNAPTLHIPVVVVNNDKGATLGIQNTNFGQLMTDTFKQVGELLDVQAVADEAAARSLLQSGKAAAAIIIPADFSESLNPLSKEFGTKKVNVQVIRDPGSPISGDIVTSVVKQILNGFMNSNIAVYAAGQASSDPLFLATQASAIAQDVAAKTDGANVPIMTLITNDSQQKQTGPAFNLLQYFAPAMAVFFLNFGMTFGAITIIEERDNGTLQRLIVSPTRRLTILAGKLAGTYVNGIMQISILVIATSLISPLLGNTTPVWGSNILALIVLIPIVVAGSVGLGTLIAGIAKTQRQAGIYGSAILSIMGLVGGAFGTPSGGLISKFTVNYWSTNAFSILSQTGDLTAVLSNIAALLGIFVVCFGAGVMLFNRRMDI